MAMFVLPREQVRQEVPFVQTKNNLLLFPSLRVAGNLIWTYEHEYYLDRERARLSEAVQELVSGWSPRRCRDAGDSWERLSLGVQVHKGSLSDIQESREWIQ